MKIDGELTIIDNLIEWAETTADALEEKYNALRDDFIEYLYQAREVLGELEND